MGFGLRSLFMKISSVYKVINKARFRPRLLGFILAGFSSSFRVSKSSVLEFIREIIFTPSSL